MKVIGLIGGIWPESTLVYYKEIIASFKPSYNTRGFPEILIDSLNLKTLANLADNNEWHVIIKILTERFEQLRQAGADFGAIAASTPHRVFYDVQNRTKLPLINIVTESCNYIKNLKLNTVCLLGTKFTMKSDFFINELNNNNIKVVLPDDRDIDYIHDKLTNELELGIIRDSTRNELLCIINKIIQSSRVQGVVLGHAGLPLIINKEDIDVNYIDTTSIHINSIIKRSME